MARTVNPKIKLRNQQIVDYFEQQLGLIGTPGGPKFTPRDPELAEKFGTSPQIVQRVLRQAGMVKKEGRRPKLTVGDKPGVSNFHTILGNELSKLVHVLILAGHIKSNGVTELGLYLRMSAHRLSTIFSGHADPTIGELIKITSACEISLIELISRVQKKEQNYCLTRLANTSSASGCITTPKTITNGMSPSEL